MSSVAQNETSLPAGQFCGTTEAARILGLSVGTVQSLVERQELMAWKTRGGHRRISMASVEEYQRRNHAAASGGVVNERIMWVQESGALRQKLVQNLSRWGITLKVDWFDNVVEASMGLQGLRPGLVVVDLKTQHSDALQFIRHVHGQPEFRSLTVLVFSTARLPEDLLVVSAGAQVHSARKPLDWSWLRGYCEAYQMIKLRQPMH
jgi:excisionase family DNA binding protein